ncbi:tRNA pseudouridine synthase A [Alteracholeplasma palmae J233]|uniref:tRNA pseudouridine synthase A n=2 Tax=Acholeplasma palmae TaxID=38986 RepID=U4KQN5_ALTPJ|nr:tRNA pseudouridine synthase A [Alteracholeplasma palmae J233]
MVVSYDGTNYHGYQMQPHETTIQEVIEKALELMTKIKIKTYAASRTDKGVHAEGQVLHFETDLKIEANTFTDAVNKRLPNDIKIVKTTKKNESFHARHSAKSKVYHYVFSKKELTPFNNRFQVYIPNLDYELMKQASNLFIGTHDFTAFGTEIMDKTVTKTMYQVELKETRNAYIFIVHGNHFLKYMVRSMVGTLIDIGRHKKTMDIITKMFETKDRKLAGKTADAKGLCLKRIYYK